MIFSTLLKTSFFHYWFFIVYNTWRVLEQYWHWVIGYWAILVLCDISIGCDAEYQY